MKHEREFDTNYFHNPIVQGVNYSVFIMLLKEMELMEMRGNPERLRQRLPTYRRSLQISFMYSVLLCCPIVKSPDGSFI
jgi:hypothetical protein